MSEYIYERPDQPARVVRDGWNVKIEWDFVQREEIIRCRDCERVSCDEFGNGWCAENCREVKPWDFCAWGERKCE